MKYKTIENIPENPTFSTISQLASLRTQFLFIINFKKDKILLFPLPVTNNKVLYKFPKHSNYQEIAYNGDVNLTLDNTGFKEYQQKFSYVQRKIADGEIVQINLTQATPIKLDQPLQTIFNISSALYKLYVPNDFIVFSPETFIQIENNVLITHPMKGTIDAAVLGAEENILNDIKEKEEHQKVIDMVKSEFSKLSDNVWIERYRYISKIKTQTKTLLQISSEVRAELESNWQNNLGELLDTILPAASICGVPKNNAIKIINDIECYDRGFYTGIMGVFTGDSLDSAVMIRFIEQNGGDFFYKSGGGITEMSDVQKEFEELKNKIYVPIY